tara:strand:+ start:254 stop:1168 length:915 start_codon:yes stop_codon:yes gene_type:complete
MPFHNTLLNMTTAEPVSTDVHSNINDLIAQSDKTHLWQKALGEVEKSMSGYKHPEPIAGTAPDIALSPLVAAKSIPNLLKMVKKINLKNPIYHHTSIPKAKEILGTQKIIGMPQPDKFLKDVNKPTRAFSVTRDPKFLSRPHSNIGTDVRFIMDRDELIRKGYRLKPYAEESFSKTLPYTHTQYGKMNPRFEFEERVLGNLPTKDIKLIDWVKTPKEYIQKLSDWTGYPTNTMPVPSKNFYDLIESVLPNKNKLPLMMSEEVRSSLRKIQPYLMNVWGEGNQYEKLKAWEKLMSAPTYKYNPFK